jgi:hypothetical protein
MSREQSPVLPMLQVLNGKTLESSAGVDERDSSTASGSFFSVSATRTPRGYSVDNQQSSGSACGGESITAKTQVTPKKMGGGSGDLFDERGGSFAALPDGESATPTTPHPIFSAQFRPSELARTVSAAHTPPSDPTIPEVSSRLTPANILQTLAPLEGSENRIPDLSQSLLPGNVQSQLSVSIRSKFFDFACSSIRFSAWFVPAALPSILFSALALDDARGEIFDIDIGDGKWVQVVLYPALSFLVNLATAKPSQREFLDFLKKLFARDTKNKALYRLSFAAFFVVACVAAVAAIPMADDARKKLGMTSENARLDIFLKVLAIFWLCGLYTVITRLTAAFALFTKEIPDFIRWGKRKYYLARTNDPEKRLAVFLDDVKCHVNGLSSEKHLQTLNALLQVDNISPNQFQVYLNDLGYRMFPTKTKMVITALLFAGVGPLEPLLYSLALQGANTLGLHEILAKMIAAAATAMTLIFYVRAAIKFAGRMTDSFAALTDAFFPNAKIRFFIGYSFMLALISVGTSAGFVYENKKFNHDSSEAVQRVTEIWWMYYSGLVANGSFTALESGKVGQSRLDNKVVEQNGASLKGNKNAMFANFEKKLSQPQSQTSTNNDADDFACDVLRLTDSARRGVAAVPVIRYGATH